MTGGVHVYFGGTFDPPHLAHHEMLSSLLADAWVERVHVVPTGLNPLKSGDAEPLGDPAQRLKWTELWLSQLPREKIVLETLELDRTTNEPHYTIDTLTALRERAPAGQKWALCIGGDIPKELHRWKRIDELLARLHSVWVFPRGAQVNPLADMDARLSSLCEFRIMATSITEISSTEIRAWLKSDNASQKIAGAPLLPIIRRALAPVKIST